MWKQVIKILYPLCDEILYSLDPSHYRGKKPVLNRVQKGKVQNQKYVIPLWAPVNAGMK